MKAKLIKTDSDSHHNGHYFLNDEEGFAIGSTDYEWCRRVAASKPQYKLSKQNCDEIFGIVNVEELAKEVCDDTISSPYHCYIAGFNKNAELNKDKVFTIEDMKRGCSLIFLALGDGGDITTDEVIESVLSTQQPTEIEVEIMMESSKFIVDKSQRDDVRNGFNYRPKLDSQGCLILKRVV